MIALGLAHFFLRERHHFAEGQREIERRVSDRTEVGVRARLGRLLVRDDGEVDLLALRLVRHMASIFALGANQYLRITPTTTPCTCT